MRLSIDVVYVSSFVCSIRRALVHQLSFLHGKIYSNIQNIIIDIFFQESVFCVSYIFTRTYIITECHGPLLFIFGSQNTKFSLNLCTLVFDTALSTVDCIQIVQDFRQTYQIALPLIDSVHISDHCQIISLLIVVRLVLGPSTTTLKHENRTFALFCFCGLNNKHAKEKYPLRVAIRKLHVILRLINLSIEIMVVNY